MSPSRGQDHPGDLWDCVFSKRNERFQMVRNFYYRKQADVVLGSANMAGILVTDGAGMNLSPTQISNFGTLNTALQAAWTAATTPETRPPVAIEAKDLA